MYIIIIDQREWTKLYPLEKHKKAINEDISDESKHFGSLDGGIPGRYAHSCVFFQGKLYLYGGRNDVRFFEEVECFDTGMYVCLYLLNVLCISGALSFSNTPALVTIIITIIQVSDTRAISFVLH